ncbi:MAG TPA: histidine kinase [Draconibacterium sp.]|nr:histidine kinase [Draconibacterium sp.]
MTISNIRNKLLPLVMHILAWMVLIILPQIIINRYWGNNNYIAWGFYFNASIYGIIFYINYLWLVPRFYLNNKRTYYLILAIAIIVILYFVFILINENIIHNPERDKAIAEAIKKLAEKKVIPRPPFRQLQVYYFALIAVIITGFSIGLRVIEQHSASEKKQKELEKEKLNSELAFLKNQVSPHFFFNTLNNIYALIEVNSNDAQEAVLKLSKLMRYLLYESEQGLTGLDNEINFMNHYIDLMKLRLSPKVDLQVDLPAVNTNKKVPPLLFIPFIENAFKHGISYREKSFIHILLKIEKNKIVFSCKNSLGKQSEEKPVENHSGIGLENVQKRLHLLFPEKHQLDIMQAKNEYSVYLEISINS